MKSADCQAQIQCLPSEDGSARGPEMRLVCCGEDVNNRWEQTERGLKKLRLSSRAPGFGRRLLHLLLVLSGLSAVLGRAVVWFHLPAIPRWFPVPSFQNTIRGVLITLRAQSAHRVPPWHCTYTHLWVLGWREMRSLSGVWSVWSSAHIWLSWLGVWNHCLQNIAVKENVICQLPQHLSQKSETLNCLIWHS